LNGLALPSVQCLELLRPRANSAEVVDFAVVVVQAVVAVLVVAVAAVPAKVEMAAKINAVGSPKTSSVDWF
jgi:hypothetical protein